MLPGLYAAKPVVVSNPIMINLDSNIFNEISIYVEDFSSIDAIFHFKGFWPSLSELHAWISKFLESIISYLVKIFLVAKGFW